MRNKIKVFGIWDTAYSGIYSAKSPASGVGNVGSVCEIVCATAYVAAAIM
jgi:hypothetical protein